MYDIFSREPDPLDRMLRPPSSPEQEMLRQSIYVRTRRMLHRRRRVRQFAYAAALVVSFAAGAGFMRMTMSGERGRVSAPSTPDLKTLTQPRSPAPDDTPLAREWTAFDSETNRGELYRQAGDSYMTDVNDLQSALRCYSNALDNGNEQDLTISANDNWLLMAIKDARQKEKNYAKQGG